MALMYIWHVSTCGNRKHNKQTHTFANPAGSKPLLPAICDMMRGLDCLRKPAFSAIMANALGSVLLAGSADSFFASAGAVTLGAGAVALGVGVVVSLGASFLASFLASGATAAEEDWKSFQWRAW